MVAAFSKAFKVILLASAGTVLGCSAEEMTTGASSSEIGDREARTAARFEALRGTPELASFLRAMPKGGDLHNHLSGAVYAESYIAWARQDGLCLDRNRMGLVPAAQFANPGVVPMPASNDEPLYDQIVRAWSMKDFTP